MKVKLIYAMALGMAVVTMVGCGNADDPIREVPKPPSEPLVPTDLSVVGSWQLQGITWFKNGIEAQREDLSSFPYILTLEPDAIFDVTYSVPVKMYVDQSELEGTGLEHLYDQDIIVTFRGKFQTKNNQLWLNLTSASASPKEAGEIDSDFEEPIFLYHFDDSGPLDYSSSDDGNRLQLKKEDITPEGNTDTVILLHHRLNGEQNSIK